MTTTVHITKYALSDGIRKEVAFPYETAGGEQYWDIQGFCGMLLVKDKEAFASRKAAVIDANRRRDAKIKSLQKQIDKLKALEFK